MNGNDGYAVFFFPQALEALGEAIKPYLHEGPAGPHVVCNGIDTAGTLIEMSLNGSTEDGKAVEVELMVPSGMVRMIVSAHSDEMFGFAPHALRGAVQDVPPVAEDVGNVAAASMAKASEPETSKPETSKPETRKPETGKPAPSVAEAAAAQPNTPAAGAEAEKTDQTAAAGGQSKSGTDAER